MELNIISPSINGDSDNLFESRFVAGNVGDIIICPVKGEYLQRLVDSGLIINMDTYIEDSALYGTYLRWDSYSEMGYPQINTLKDLLPILADIQAAHPYSDSGALASAQISLFQILTPRMLIYDPLVIASGSHDPSGYVNVRLSLTVILTSVNLTGPPSEASAEAGMLVETPIRLKLVGSVVLPSAVLVKLGLSSVTVYVSFPSSLATKKPAGPSSDRLKYVCLSN